MVNLLELGLTFVPYITLPHFMKFGVCSQESKEELESIIITIGLTPPSIDHGPICKHCTCYPHEYEYVIYYYHMCNNIGVSAARTLACNVYNAMQARGIAAEAPIPLMGKDP
jgi:hypothetical protein